MPANEQQRFHPDNFEGELFGRLPDEPGYPRSKEYDCRLALREAMAWLKAQGLIIPDEGVNGSNGYCVLSRRAKRFESSKDFETHRLSRSLNRELLHQRIAEPVWLAFVRGDYAYAIFTSMREVEVAVREASNAPQNETGVKLMNRVFGKAGPLRDPSAEEAEENALQHLFAGALGRYKNPHSHRLVEIENVTEAIQVVHLASLLLQEVDRRKSTPSQP